MTNYEEFLKAKKITERAVKDIHLALGRNERGDYDRRNDKHCFKFSLDSKSLDMGHGYYGSSSYYRSNDSSTVSYVQQACNELAHVIGEKAIKLALEDLEKKRIAALDEARQVFNDCESKPC